MKYKLDDIDKKETFKVPDGYFEDLPLKIQQRISTGQKKQRRGIPVWSLAMAASVIVILTFIFLIPDNNSAAEDMLAEIPQDELIAYLDQLELDEFDIASAMGEDVNAINLEDMNILDGIDLGDEAIDDVLLEYDLEDEYL